MVVQALAVVNRVTRVHTTSYAYDIHTRYKTVLDTLIAYLDRFTNFLYEPEVQTSLRGRILQCNLRRPCGIGDLLA